MPQKRKIGSPKQKSKGLIENICAGNRYLINELSAAKSCLAEYVSTTHTNKSADFIRNLINQELQCNVKLSQINLQ